MPEFPGPNCRGIDCKYFAALPVGVSQAKAQLLEFSGNACSLVTEGIVSQECDNTRVVLYLRHGPAIFPVRYRILRHIDCLRHVPLQEPPFKPRAADVVSEGIERRGKWHTRRLSDNFLVRENTSHHHVHAAILTIRRRNVSVRREWCKNI